MVKSIEQIKIIYDKLDETKEKLQLQIQTIFTKIRNVLNEREDKLLLELDNKFNEIYFKEDLPEKSKKLLNEINILFEKGKLIESKWENEKLNLIINDCIQFEEKVFNFFFIESNIIDNDDYTKNIINWLYSNKIFKTKLLYSLSRDGEKVSKFHELCDNKGNTLTLFHTKDGNKVGIYTNLSWDCNSGWKKGNETFLFNLNKNRKYKIRDNKESICCLPNYGPYTKYFGCETSMDKIIHYYDSINSYFENADEYSSK